MDISSVTDPQVAVQIDDLFRGPGNVERPKYVTRLKTAWLNEQLAPDLLPYEQEVVDALLEKTQEQQETIDENSHEVDTHFMIQLFQMELERVKYMLQSYLRIRLWKIQKYHQFVSQKNPKQYNLLSVQEQKFLKGYSRTVEAYLSASFLSFMPDNKEVRSLLGTDSLGLNMVPEPNTDTFIFVRVNEDIGEYQVDTGEAGETESLMKDDVLLLPYHPIKPLLLKKKLELI